MGLKITHRTQLTNEPVTYMRVKHRIDQTYIIAAIYTILQKNYGVNSEGGVDYSTYTVDIYKSNKGDANRAGIERVLRKELEYLGTAFIERFCEDKMNGGYNYDITNVKKEDVILFMEINRLGSKWFPEWFNSNAEQYIRSIK